MKQRSLAKFREFVAEKAELLERIRVLELEADDEPLILGVSPQTPGPFGSPAMAGGG